MRKWLLVGLVVLAVVLGSAAPASAHNQLTGSDPEDGANLRQGPERVRLTFLASVDAGGAELAVTGPDGASAMTGEPEFEGTGVTIPAHAPLAGEYEVTYRVPSTDGHWAEGSITFTVTAGDSPSRSPSPSPSPSPAASSPPAEAVAPAAGIEPDDGGSGPAWWVWLLIALAVAGAGYGVIRWRRSAATSAG